MNAPSRLLPYSCGEFLKFTLPSVLETMPPRAKAASTRTRILVAEDDPVSLELVSTRLEGWGYDVVMTRDGTEAMMALRKMDAPSLAILDWMMPGMDGLEICRRTREVDRLLYVILLTARGGDENLVEGLGAGADDYLIKPFNKNELQARILVGLRTIRLQTALAKRVSELEGGYRGRF